MSNKETPQVIAAILLSCAGVFMVFGMPFFVGGLISELGFSQAQANLISSAEIAGIGTRTPTLSVIPLSHPAFGFKP